jgi:hypothetical protein
MRVQLFYYTHFILSSTGQTVCIQVNAPDRFANDRCVGGLVGGEGMAEVHCLGFHDITRWVGICWSKAASIRPLQARYQIGGAWVSRERAAATHGATSFEYL